LAYYKDIRAHLKVLEQKGKLRRIKRSINKDTELMPLVRLQYRGLPEEERRAFLFENITDAKGKKYNGTVAVSALAGSTEIYALGLMCQPGEILEKLANAETHPIEPKLVKKAPVQEEVHMAEGLMEHGALDEFPIPISLPGFDSGPCMTAAFWVTKDPESGIRNVGTYRVMPKTPVLTGIDYASKFRGGAIHYRKAQERGQPLPAAIVIGGPPSIGYVSVTTYPTDTDELAVAGGIAGEPLEVVKCKTVDLEVPAHAEIIVEGEIGTDEVEMEGPFGESIGFLCLEQPRPLFHVKCITHRKNPIWVAFISQFQPSESSIIKKLGADGTIYKKLRYDLGMDFVKKVALEETSDTSMVVIQVGRTSQENVWRALEATAKYHEFSKLIIAVDDFVDPNDLSAVLWEVTHTFQPYRDSRVITKPSTVLLDCSLAPMQELERLREEMNAQVMWKGEMPDNSIMLINGTIKWPYPPISLPRNDFMEKALEIWKSEGLPPLKLKQPWFGIDLGYWSEADKQKAEWAIKGEYYKTGEAQAKTRKPA
jgi:4-hydroxy-3-polyprenylbenzoate decarboxylase